MTSRCQCNAYFWKVLIPCRCHTRVDDEIPVEDVGLISYLCVGWLDGFMWKAFRRGVDPQTIPTCPQRLKAKHTSQRLEELWKEELISRGAEHASLWRVFLRYSWQRLLVAIVVLLTSFFFLLLVSTYFLFAMLSFTNDGSQPGWQGALLVVGLLVGTVLGSLLFQAVFTITNVCEYFHVFLLFMIPGAGLRSAVLGTVYNKLMRILSVREDPLGHVVNLVASDSQRVFEGISHAPMLLTAPLLAVGATVYAMLLMGWWPLIGFAVLCCLCPAQYLLGKTTVHYRRKVIERADTRIRYLSEVLKNIKFIKMYAWEEPHSNRIMGVRSEERRAVEKENLATSLGFITSATLVTMATMLTLISYTLAGNQLTAVQAFTYLGVFGVVREKLELSVVAVRSLSEMIVAAHRLQCVLVLEEVRPHPLNQSISSSFDMNMFAVEMRSVTACWPDVTMDTQPPVNNTNNTITTTTKDTTTDVDVNTADDMAEDKTLTSSSAEYNVPNVLHDVNVRIEKGDVVGIVGATASGKTALLQAILGQLRLIDGHVTLYGSVSYVPQSPWIFNASIRENIILGHTFDENRYHAVLDACCLDRDLDDLTAGDLTEVGERGVTLSNGQKSRVCLARALYSDRDICLLDDPFASLDPDIAELVYQKSVQGFLLGKTIIMVSHQLKYFPDCDYILHIQGGVLVEQGTHSDLMDASGQYCDVISAIPAGNTHKAREHGVNQVTSPNSTSTPYTSTPVPDVTSPQTNNHSTHNGGRAETLTSQISQTQSLPGKHLMTSEDREDGVISWSTYRGYVRAAGGVWAVVVVMVLALLAEGCRVFSYWWLAIWISDVTSQRWDVDNDNSTLQTNTTSLPEADGTSYYHLIYSLSLVAILIFFTLRSIILVKVLIRASTYFHNSLLRRLLSCPLAFYDTTPLGRLINKFSKDLDELDSRLPPWIDHTLRSLVGLLLSLIIITIIIKWFIFTLIPVIALFVFCYTIFRVGVRELKRLYNISMSPLISHVTGSIHGLHSIRAYNKQNDFTSKFFNLLDDNTSLLLLWHLCTRWVTVRMGFLASAIVGVTSFAVVLLTGTMHPAYAGVAIMYSLQVTYLLQYCVRCVVETEARFTCAERYHNYIQNLEVEGGFSVCCMRRRPSTLWPLHGHMTFIDLHMKYRPGLPEVIRGISCDVMPGHKVGIVGRTGSGKSSLVTSLWRLVEPSGGGIAIDGVNLSDLSLARLRSSLSIIPQDPVLFSASIRSNLDPLQRHTDEEIWRALEQCHIKYTISCQEGGLDYIMAEGGEEFSAGERQLLCVTRVVLRHSQIVVLDEPLACVDTETDDRLQKTLATVFADCTVLLVTHRIDRVLRCDKVMVMDQGQILEYDSPESLLAEPSSVFSHMLAVSHDSHQGKSLQDLHEIHQAWV